MCCLPALAERCIRRGARSYALRNQEEPVHSNRNTRSTWAVGPTTRNRSSETVIPESTPSEYRPLVSFRRIYNHRTELRSVPRTPREFRINEMVMQPIAIEVATVTAERGPTTDASNGSTTAAEF
jgi:hypothetical protein